MVWRKWLSGRFRKTILAAVIVLMCGMGAYVAFVALPAQRREREELERFMREGVPIQEELLVIDQNDQSKCTRPQEEETDRNSGTEH